MMVILFFILTIVVFFIVEYIFSKRKSEDLSDTRATESVKIPSSHSLPEVIEQFFHPGHTWAQVEAEKPVLTGIDDFSQRLIGQIEEIIIPRAGTVLRQGDPFVTLRRKSKKLVFPAPISGRIVEINSRVLKSPSLINKSPLEKGWIAKFQPVDLKLETPNLMNSRLAGHWNESLRAQLIRWFSPTPALLMQDGGQIIENISDLVSDAEWPALVNDFFALPQTSTQSSERIKQ